MRESETVSADNQYQTLLAQRSIARAALHLGIDTLPSNTLTVLQDALTHYLERVGRVIGNNVENGGRSSSHVNVLDAIRAVEDCSFIGGVNLGNGNGLGHAGQYTSGSTGDWGDLARFLYGAEFDLDSAVNEPARNGNMERDPKDDVGGWNAPLDDYDSIPLFPVHVVGHKSITQNILADDGNTKPSAEKEGTGTSKTGSKSDGRTTPTISTASAPPTPNVTGDDKKSDKETAASKAKPTAKRKREDDSSEPSIKRSTTNGNDAADTKMNRNNEDASNNSTSLPPYIPNFLPPFPPKHTYKKSTRPVSAPVEAFQAEYVRSSLVQLGQSYWGAMAPEEDTNGNGKRGEDRNLSVKVKTAPVDVSGANGGLGPRIEVKQAVKPVIRASKARVSRILEGSMDIHS